VAGPLGQMLRCRVTAGEVTDMAERSAARGGVDIDLLQGGPVVRIRLPPAESPSLSRSCFRGSRTPAWRTGMRIREDLIKLSSRPMRAREPTAMSLC